ncbi:nucleotidyltransferase domain-containing protein [Nocardioides rubriscoriae]|uniref:nucleotidyltransferase domain-containing protein n=1 Tax=Nocardioides rubriscoriae TaxID=642762 RepID=UPI001FE511F8|nr:hypothetical protein [Nocardioides rubriscoriae]
MAVLLEGYPGPWWIAGGWAIEAFTGVSRGHSDIDPSIPRSDVASFHRHLAGRLDVWTADSGVFRALVEADEPVPPTCENLWLRASGAAPWEYDVILMDVVSGTWTFKRDARIALLLAQVLWTQDGIAYLRPEIQLLHKARALRPQDQFDFDAAAPLLAPGPRAWLRWALDLAHPGRRWAAAL